MARRHINGSRAIVTGASSGIGKAIALEFSRRKTRLILTARREEELQKLVQKIRAMGSEAYFVAGDICDEEVRQQIIDSAERHFNGIDILVNNAGIGAIGPFSEATGQQLRQIMEVNFFAPLETIRLALPLLSTSDRPMIVNIGSVLGHRAVPLKSEYCASKFALHGFSDALRAELSRRNIDVLLVSPSTTKSNFFDRAIRQPPNKPSAKVKGKTSEWVAKKTIQAITRGKHEIILTAGGKLLVWSDRLFPTWMDRLVTIFGQKKQHPQKSRIAD